MLQRFASLSILRQSGAPSWLTTAMPHSTSPSLFLSTLTTSTSNNNTTTTTSPLFPPQNQLSIQTRSRSNRSQRGLYDGKDVSFGNNVPFSMKKTRRRWNPNVQYKRVYSEVLDEMVPFHITTSALRSIDKYGGLDEYLLRSRHVSTKGEGEGQRIRNRIIQKMKHREALKNEAIDRGESVEDWERIVLVGAKIKQPTSTSAAASASVQEEES